MPDDGPRASVGGLGPLTAARYCGAGVALLLAGVAAWDVLDPAGGAAGITGA